MKVSLICFSLFFFPVASFAQLSHQLVRRIVVFPIKTETKQLKVAEDAWWKIREELTTSRRFLVASRNFLINKDVFQARRALKPADAIILGKLLDANALVVTYVKKRVLSMRVYEGETGFLLWQQNHIMHPSLPVHSQIEKSSLKLIRNFIAQVPYHGFQIVDSMVGKPVFEEGDVQLARVNVGIRSQIQAGETVQWVSVDRKDTGALFQSAGKVVVYAEGKVVKVERELMTVEILRVKDIDRLKENSLIRVPEEGQRLQARFSETDQLLKKIEPEFFSEELREIRTGGERNQKALMAALAFIGHLAAFLLLAF